MNHQIFTAGDNNPESRSDCFVSLQLKESGNISTELNSIVDVMYGKSIKTLARTILEFFEIKHAHLKIEDTGALDFVLAARIETVVKMAIQTDKEFLTELISENKYSTKKDRFRFSRLYLPGNSPKMMLNAGLHKAYGIILDLEDSVAPSKKHEARLIVRNALRSLNFYGAERMVRINQLPGGLEDIKYIASHYVNLILIPKCESAEQIHSVEAEIQKEREKHGFNYPIHLMPIIESALGVEKSYEIACASENVVAMAIGLEDYTADIGVQRTKEAKESFYAGTRIVNACKATGIQPIDSVFSDVADEEGLRNTVLKSKALGFEGIGCIHPRQITPIHESFAPVKAEIEKSVQIIKAFNEAAEKGLGVIAIGSKMIDLPVVKRAQKIFDLALELNLLPKN